MMCSGRARSALKKFTCTQKQWFWHSVRGCQIPCQIHTPALGVVLVTHKSPTS